MNPYENIQLGNFLVSLGYKLCSLQMPLVTSINLLQQTPLDKPIGDVLGAMGGKFFIIEFKRNATDLKKEYTKTKYKNLLKAIAQNPNINEFSKKCHLLSYGYETEQKDFDFIFSSYVNTVETEVKINSILAFITKVFTASFGADFKEFKQYIALLNKCASSSSSASSSSTVKTTVENMTGLIICVDKNNKMFQSSFHSLNELNRYLELDIDFTLEIKKKVRRDIGKSRGFER